MRLLASAFAEYLRIVWLTPDLDALFRGPAGDRRRFLDRLVLAVDSEHGTRVGAMERALRSRNRMLEESPDNRLWLDAVEREVAELAIAVAAARRETVQRLAALIRSTRDDDSPVPVRDAEPRGRDRRAGGDAFRPSTRRTVIGRSCARTVLRDRAAGRTLVGPQATDMLVRHGPKDIPANLASTGEQKALLIGLVLAHAQLVGSMTGIAPFILLDEVAAHLDPRRRAGLFDDAWRPWADRSSMTGADPDLFAELAGPRRPVACEPRRGANRMRPDRL